MRSSFEPEKENIQGLVARGYGHHPWAAYVLLRVGDGAAARKWLAAREKEITSAADVEDPRPWRLNLAFSWKGLCALGLREDDSSQFPATFQEGMVTAHRSRVLGDDEHSLQYWRWGASEAREAHVLVMIYAAGKKILQRRLQQAMAGQTGLVELQTLHAERQPSAKEHFGFADGIGQPTIEGFEKQSLGQLKRTGNAVALKPGEFLLGYTNEFGTVTEESNEFGRNGAYLVFRQFEQHVDRFKDYFRTKSKGDSQVEARLKAKVVGRWPSGTPLALAPYEDDPSLAGTDDFSYADDDPHGFCCPIGAHIRRANPRDSLEADPDEAMRRSRRRRLLRRGRSYGTEPTSEERGLHFICLCGDIERQYEFVQQSWINNPSFAELQGEADPLTGPRIHSEGGRFTIQREPVRERLKGLPAFVTVRGGGYFFLPGIPALRKLAGISPKTNFGVPPGRRNALV